MYSDDLVLIGENLEVSKILEEWRVGLEGNKL
jgi:hypothetical protein